MTDSPSRFDCDPEALAWARAKVQGEIDRAEKFVQQATANEDTVNAEFWRRHALHLHRSFIGGDGCVMGRFDERRPALVPADPAGQAPATDQAALRDRLVSALDTAFQTFVSPLSDAGVGLELSEHLADAVLSVLPAPADRAATEERAARWETAALKAGREVDRNALRVYMAVADAEQAGLRRMADEAQQPAMPDVETLAAALDGLHTLIATSSRDWQTYRVDAWLWAVLCGWDCEQAEHDDTCTHGALEETAAMHGWDDATVAKARRYRAAVRILTGPAEAQQPKETRS